MAEPHGLRGGGGDDPGMATAARLGERIAQAIDKRFLTDADLLLAVARQVVQARPWPALAPS